MTIITRTCTLATKHTCGWLLGAALAILWLPTATQANVHDPRALEADPTQAQTPIAPRLQGLGNHTQLVSTNNPDSQYFFNQGLRLTYAFNHSEALRAFKEAIRLDPNNAMAYWGWALVLGPNLNLPMVPAVNEQAFSAIQQALLLSADVSARERAYIEALATRYAPVAPNDRSSLDQDYANAMAEVHARFPEDLDAATLYAAALMNLSPWNYWEKNGAARPNTTQLLATLEQVINQDPDHPGALHYYIHAVEAAHPRRGESAADALGHLMPSAGHMVHMPSHIYMRVGRYADSFSANKLASEADAGYISQCNAQGIYPLSYYPHNLHFMVWSAMFQGRAQVALEVAREVQSKVPKNREGNAFGAFETFWSQPMYVMVRFAQWQAVLDEPKPDSDMRFANGVWHYARGIALANSDKPTRARLRQAQRELDALTEARKQIPADYFIGFGSAPKLLTIAELVLQGDIASKRGQHDQAIAALSRAARLEDSLRYNEPPDWYFPTRHVLGALLLDAGYPDEAEAVYWQDLRKNPSNGFSLMGLQQALTAQGQSDGAERIRLQYQQAWRDADTQLTSSRF